MSGLVSGLQNRVRRFESARDLKRPAAENFGCGSFRICRVVAKFFYGRGYVLSFQKIMINFATADRIAEAPVWG